MPGYNVQSKLYIISYQLIMSYLIFAISWFLCFYSYPELLQ